MSECIICNKPFLPDEVYCFEESPVFVTPVCPDCWLKLSKKHQPHLDNESVDAGVKCDCAGCGYWKRTKTDSVSVGALTLSRHNDKIWIGVDGGEGSEFDEKAVETALREFYDKNF